MHNIFTITKELGVLQKKSSKTLKQNPCADSQILQVYQKFMVCGGVWQGSLQRFDRVLNTPQKMYCALYIRGFWICFRFWICRGSGYTMVLNMPELHRVLNMPEYVWIPAYAWICLNCTNGFCFTFTYCNSLSKGTIDSFLGK